MHGCVPPPLVKESTSAVEVVKVLAVTLAPPKVHVCNLKVAPKMARRVSSLLVVSRAVLGVRQPPHGVVRVYVFRMLGHELQCLRPEGLNGFGRVVDVDDETVRLVIILHVLEDVVVNVTEEAG